MNSPTLSLTFSIDSADPMATLEQVLATARRGGLCLASIAFTHGAHDASAAMRLRADDADRLDLFVLRLGNLIDVGDVICHSAPPLPATAAMRAGPAAP